MKKKKRTSYVVMTNEARVLKKLREEAGFSMRVAGRIMGCSESLVSQIENGRENPPSGERLKRFLDAYGVDQRVFAKKLLNYKNIISDDEVAIQLIKRLPPDAVKMIRLFAEQLLGKS
jgi:transcriptional regulator with XRE-family HTH domain